MTPPTGLAKALRAHARGLHPLEAAAELLVSHTYWLHRSDFTTDSISTRRGLLIDIELAHVDWPSAITALDIGYLPCSAGEGRILRLAASLADGIPVDLRDALTSLDADNIDLVARAVLHAAGRPQTLHMR
jgi:hypothetical protein